jgi:hypothetical protein
MGEPADERDEHEDERDDEYDVSLEDEEELMRRCDEAEKHPERLVPRPRREPAKLAG